MCTHLLMAGCIRERSRKASGTDGADVYTPMEGCMRVSRGASAVCLRSRVNAIARAGEYKDELQDGMGTMQWPDGSEYKVGRFSVIDWSSFLVA